jgi:3-deoxy-D-manno-octulosonic-acid transferase
MRALYTLLWYVALPMLPLRLWWRGRREPGYRARIGERFGRYARDAVPAQGDVVWIHAVSLGETRAAEPLVRRIARDCPHATILLTSMTATGREAGRALADALGAGRVIQSWLPYDVPRAVDAFLDRFAPRAGLLMETELWPNLVHACRMRGVPLYLVNARMSAKSAAGYARLGSMTRPMLASLAGIAAQTPSDAQRLAALGAPDVTVTGSLKFDMAVPAAMLERGRALRERLGRDRAVWLAASTRDGEEALLLDAMARGALPPNALLLLVPRHPQRFDEVFALVAARGLACVRRSSDQPVDRSARVVLGDSLGEMLAYCAAADVTFVGGSLLPLGGQNLLEPIAVGVPTLVGPHTFNFAETTERAIEAGAARRVADAEALIVEIDRLLRDPRERAAMAAAATAFVAAHRGAAERLWEWLAPRLARAFSRPAGG